MHAPTSRETMFLGALSRRRNAAELRRAEHARKSVDLGWLFRRAFLAEEGVRIMELGKLTWVWSGVICLLAPSVMAQQGTTTGLLENGLVLTGTVMQPVLANHASRRVLVWASRWVLKRPDVSSIRMPFTDVRVFTTQFVSKSGADLAALAPGQSRTYDYQEAAHHVQQGEVPVAVSLDLAMFDDGEVVGPDLGQSLSRIEAAAPAVVPFAETNS